jgi:hypothetical protein
MINEEKDINTNPVSPLLQNSSSAVFTPQFLFRELIKLFTERANTFFI